MASPANSLITPQNVKTNAVLCVNAKTNLQDSTNAVRLIAQDQVPNGGLIKRLYAIPRGATASDTQIQLYRSFNFGVSLLLADTAVLPTYQPVAGSAIVKGEFPATPDAPFRVGATEEIWVAIGTASAAGIVIVVEYEAY